MSLMGITISTLTVMTKSSKNTTPQNSTGWMPEISAENTAWTWSPLRLRVKMIS